MMEKTKLIFADDVKNGYVHYINFKRDFSGALETFRKYIVPVDVRIGIDANNDWIILTVSYDEDMEDYLEILQEQWDILTKWLKEENIQFAYPTRYGDWTMLIPIDDFVEWVLKKYILNGEVK